MQDQFKISISPLANFTDEEYQRFRNQFTKINLAKGEYWFRSGKVCNQLAFIESGIMRQYYVMDDGNEVTCHFALNGEFITSYQSFRQHIVSNENIEAITDCDLLIIDQANFSNLMSEFPQLKMLWDFSIQKFILQMEDRIAMLQSLSAEKRYLYLFNHHPEFLLYIPLQYIASYLGITPQHLSRLRKTIS